MDQLPPVESASCAATSAEMSGNQHAEDKMVDAKLVANNRRYLKSAVQAITCLILIKSYNRDVQDDFSKDMFYRFYQRALVGDPSLTDITDLLPPEAQFTSQDFQMAVVRSMAQMVLEKIRRKYKGSESKSFCIKGCIRHNAEEGEVLSLAIRFVNEGVPQEHLIGQLHLEQGDADYIADRILNRLTEYGLNPLYIVSQCYNDGPSFGGCSRDFHGALQKKLNQCIPDVHWLLRNGQTILEAIYALLPFSPKFLDMDVCLPLLNITRVCRIALAKEIPGAKPLLSCEISAGMDHVAACEVVYKHSATFPALYEVYVTAVLMLSPLSDCERFFPVPVQCATLSEHDINVAIVAHGHAITSRLCMDAFVAVFSRNDKRLLL